LLNSVSELLILSFELLVVAMLQNVSKFPFFAGFCR
jgi:hypothetical protein